jgi:hypothetical protein
MIKFTAPVVRVYFNRKDNGPAKAWSIDLGPATPEILMSAVVVDAPCRTEFDISGVPCGWLVFDNPEVTLNGLTACIGMRRG